MSRAAEAMEEFVDEFDRYTDFVDETTEGIQVTLTNLRESTFSGELGARFEDLVRADLREHLISLHEEFSSDLIQLRADIDYVRRLEAGNVNI